MFLLLVICFFISSILVRLCLKVSRISAAERTDLVIFKVDDSGCSRIKEVAVMGNHQNAALVGAKIIFEPFQHVHVQMVRRFIQKKEIRMTDKSRRKVDTYLLPAGEGMDISVPVFILEAQSCQDLPCF